MMVRLVCGNCGKIQQFESWDAAHEAGWDTIERFGYNACEACLGVSVYLPMYYCQQARVTEDPVAKKALLDRAALITMGEMPLTPPLDAAGNPTEPSTSDPEG